METQNIEYKPSWRDEYLKVIVAFANKDGGELIVGVDDNGNPIGVKKSKKLLEDIPNKIRNKLGLIPSVKIEKVGDKDIIHIFIKPCSVSMSHNGKYYIRSGSNSFELKGEELTNFLIEKSGKTWDEFVEEKAGFDDIDIKTIDEFKKYAVDRIPSIVAEKDYQTILEKLNLKENKKLKKAAILLFGKNPQRFYPAAYLKIGKFLTKTEIQSSDIVEGNLFEQITHALEILRTKYLISKIKFEGIHRREILEYPYEALREAIINALIHRNYIGASSIQIRVYNDRLVIMNEGKLPPEVPVEKLKTEHLSKPRNTLLADVFYKAGFIESWGRGTIKIMEKCQEQGLPEPDFEEDHGVMKVVFYKDKFTEDNLRKSGISERQIKAVMYVKEKGKITNKEYRELTGLSDEGARLDLIELSKRNLIQPIGKGRSAHYILGTFGD